MSGSLDRRTKSFRFPLGHQKFMAGFLGLTTLERVPTKKPLKMGGWFLARMPRLDATQRPSDSKDIKHVCVKNNPPSSKLRLRYVRLGVAPSPKRLLEEEIAPDKWYLFGFL